MNIVILLILLLIFIFFIRDIREHFYVSYPYLWIPTRSTRLMSYDLRGDPFGYYVYPSYFSWTTNPGVPYRYYSYSPTRYDINGQYIIPKPKKLKKIK